MPLTTSLRSPPSLSPVFLPTFPPSKLQSLGFLSSLSLSFVTCASRVSLRSNGFKVLSQSRPFVSKGEIEEVGDQETKAYYSDVKLKLQAQGLNVDSCTPGNYNLLYCPKCKGGSLSLRTLSFHLNQDLSIALWRCFNLSCGWADKISLEDREQQHDRQMISERGRLEPLGKELLAYFAERKISEETLRRNNVMQAVGDEKIIAFTYTREGLFVGCKYRTFAKRFWQAKNTEKIFYGIDDIKGADEIIIVEGELDKLSMEEAGYRNCISVPSGAPQTVSLKELPTLEKDTGFQYLWNCEHYFEKAYRIVLATDGDLPGRALAEELGCRLGKERCFLVQWPKRDSSSSFKDANEVLQFLGPVALRETIQRAEPWIVSTSA